MCVAPRTHLHDSVAGKQLLVVPGSSAAAFAFKHANMSAIVHVQHCPDQFGLLAAAAQLSCNRFDPFNFLP
jgi:hypothetical protein